MTTVSFGTRAQATAVTILAPCLAIPPASYSRPTMKPVMFCRNSSGIERWSHSSTKCAPLSADSPNSTPLLATLPTGAPRDAGPPDQHAVVGHDADRVALDVREPADQRRAVELLELAEPAAVDEPRDDLADAVGGARG